MRRIAPVFASVILFLSCSDNGTSIEEDPNAGIPIGSVTKTIPPEGGSIRTRASENGAVFTLDFPEGAVRSRIAVSATPLAPDSGLWFDLALEPAGLVFFKPVDVTVSLPEGIAVGQGQMMFLRPNDPVYVPTQANTSDRTLRASIQFFGFGPDSTRTVASMPTDGLAVQAAGGNNLGGGAVDCQAVIASAQMRFDAFLGIGEFEQAIEAALEIAGILTRATCFAEAQDWIETAADLACQKLTEAISDAASTPTSAYRDFADQTGEIINWVPIALRVSPDCPALDDYASGLSNEVPDFLAFFEPRINALTANDWETFSDLKDEAISVMEVEVEATMLGLPDPVLDLLHDDAFLPAVNQMRTIAFNMCKNEGWHYPLSRLTSTGFFAARDIVGFTPPRAGSLVFTGSFADFTDADIFEDMQLCGTCADVKTKVSSGGEFSTSHFEATAPGQNTREATIDCPTRGKLVLDGSIAAFTCWNDLRADDEITVNFNFDDILTLRRPPGGNEYINGTPVEIDILQAAEQAGFVPKEGFSTDLVFTRNRADCDNRLWGSGDYEIFRTTLQWKNPTLDVEVNFPDTVDAGDETPVTVRVKVIDLLGQAGFFDAIDLALNVSGGSAAQTTGQTDANGEFTTTVTASNPSPSPGPPGAPAARAFSINVQATSFEGVTAQKTETALVIPCPATDHRFRQGGAGNFTRQVEYGHLRAWASGGGELYSYATTEWIDDFVVTPSDQSLLGQRGYVYIKVRYRFKSSGYSESRPAARVVIGPRNGYSSPYFFVNNFNTPGDGSARDIEDEWEIPISCTFGSVSAPLDVNADAFSRGPGPSTVSAEVEWIGITKVTRADGTTVGSYKICSGSGTNYR